MDDMCIENNLPREKNTENDSNSNELTQQLLQLKKIVSNSNLNIDDMYFKAPNDNLFLDDLTLYSYEFKQDQFTWCDSDVIRTGGDGRISLAYERLPGIPRDIADKFASRTHTLDLSYNSINDLTFLANFKILHTLILDNNVSLNEKTLLFLPRLRILWLNKCGITELPKWIQRIDICTPNIRQLSLIGNPGMRSSFNGGTSIENDDYMIFVIGILQHLEYLDDVKITDTQRTKSRLLANKQAEK